MRSKGREDSRSEVGVTGAEGPAVVVVMAWEAWSWASRVEEDREIVVMWWDARERWSAIVEPMFPGPKIAIRRGVEGDDMFLFQS